MLLDKFQMIANCYGGSNALHMLILHSKCSINVPTSCVQPGTCRNIWNLPNLLLAGKWQVLSTRACNVLNMFLLVSRPPCPQWKGIESGEIEWWNRWISREAVLEVFPPLAGDIVGNDNVGDPHLNTICEGGCHGVVSVDVPEFGNQFNRINKNECITFPPSGGQRPRSEGQTRGGRRLWRHLWWRTPVNSLCTLG